MITQKLTTILLGAALLLAPVHELHGHEDTHIRLLLGRLVGLPTEYRPASYDSKQRILRVKNHRIIFTPFMNSLFPKDRPHSISFVASWYHVLPAGASMPPYLNLKVKANKDGEGHEILFSLDDLSVLSIVKVTVISKTTTQFSNVVVTKDQQKAMKQAVQKLLPES